MQPRPARQAPEQRQGIREAPSRRRRRRPGRRIAAKVKCWCPSYLQSDAQVEQRRVQSQGYQEAKKTAKKI